MHLDQKIKKFLPCETHSKTPTPVLTISFQALNAFIGIQAYYESSKMETILAPSASLCCGKAQYFYIFF